MTVGEKIQFYRKKIGLSQEELGQKMLVSRQTVSLWEMDKTVPVVDNLLRLKEIFSVSIDDILSEAEPKEENKNEPKETYVFKYEKSDLKELFKKARFSLIKRTIIFTLVCVALFVYLVGINDAITGLLFGYFLIGIISRIRGCFAYSKAWKHSEGRILQSTYSYDVFDGYFMLNISRNEEIVRTLKIYADDIEKVQTFGNYLVLQISGQSYIIKKDALISDSALLAFCNNMPNKVETKKPRVLLKVIALLLQTYFIIETIRLYACGYVMWMGEAIEDAFHSMIFTLCIVVVCEVISFIDAILFVRSSKNVYSKLYLALVIINAGLFMYLAYNSTAGTAVCLSLYAVLFILRVVNLVRFSINAFKKS